MNWFLIIGKLAKFSRFHRQFLVFNVVQFSFMYDGGIEGLVEWRGWFSNTKSILKNPFSFCHLCRYAKQYYQPKTPQALHRSYNVGTKETPNTSTLYYMIYTIVDINLGLTMPKMSQMSPKISTWDRMRGALVTQNSSNYIATQFYCENIHCKI